MLGGLRGLLDEGVQNDDAPPEPKTAQRAAYAFPPARPNLEQAVAHGPRVRQAQIGAVYGEQFDQVGVVGQHIHRPGLDGFENAGMEVLDLIRHWAMLAGALTLGEAG